MQYLIISASVVTALVMLLLFTLHMGFRAPRNREKGTPANLGLEYEVIHIPTASGKHLFGWALPAMESRATIIILHGWGGNAEWMLPMALPFHQAGISVLLIDARNHGNSDSHTFSSLPRFAEDLGCAINWLKEQRTKNTEHIALLGHSLGAGAVLLEASRRRDIAAAISISAFAHPESMMRRFMSRLHLPEPITILILKYVQWVIGHRFSDIAPLKTVCRITCPVLLVHGTADETVPIDDARKIHAECPEGSISLLEIDDGGHDSVEMIDQYGAKLAAFILDKTANSDNHQPPSHEPQ